MKKILVSLLIFGGCCSPKYIERAQTDTLKVPVPADSGSFWGNGWNDWSFGGYSQDSTIHIEAARDTTKTDSGRTKWKVKYEIKHDSIPYPVEVKKYYPQEKEVFPFLSKLGLILIGLVAGGGIATFLTKSLFSVNIGGKKDA